MHSDADTGSIFEIDSPGQLMLGTSVVVALANAYKLFEKTGQDLNNFNVHIAERKKENGEDENGVDAIGIAFTAKLSPGQKGLGNASRQGRSVTYIASKTTGEIFREQGSR
ncbi:MULTISPECIES: hypothetical protein [unclassified Variovorax]|jgi:hypothetical protein|uniref:hypothetical protein n=1 Tax=unclassified Variovorax TaxID=663243 RepID=UPI000F7EDE81|nr:MULTISPECIES: hypothetical protein [unclassified Variovorax]RSZ29326.1 hypothetical protein EJO70_34140 [Variovorax sp. 553]RSZ29556.1 hypothetical protein EJO71_34140 [Variovorax sp. 679]